MSPIYYRRQMSAADLGALQHQPPVCDFCALHAPQWMYAARQSSDGTPGFVWRWCACPGCAERIEGGDVASMVGTIAEGLAHTGVPLLVRQIAAARSLSDFHRYVWYAERLAPKLP